ncbi:MAG: NAD-dependent epimerase/dehydratase family protein [Actinomycetota bacterium]|nr:NAD-dependent epimerase/dehydratase family protein [Actinomycetota bacterium]
MTALSFAAPSRRPETPERPATRTRAVVTGAAGFVGSHVVERLLTDGWTVRGVDALTDTYDPALKLANLSAAAECPGFDLVVTDLVDADLMALLDGATAVFHLAGEPGVAGSWGPRFDRYAHWNVIATQRLLEAAVEVGVKRFIYASSSSVYGHRAARPARETDLPAPRSPYGVSKLAAEHLVGAYARERSLTAVSLRYFTVYGPRQRPDMAFHRFILAALGDRDVVVHGSGRQVRDCTYVDDVVAATVAAAQADFVPGEVLNVGGGRPTSLLQVLDLLGELLGGRPAIVHVPPRPGDVARTEAATDRARARLSWAPATGLAAGLARQVAWQRLAGRQPITGSVRPPDLRSAESPGTATRAAAAAPS